jgi:predicted O-linked N-acetylglucosamine transferase (SPINDLY family)
MDTYGGKWQGLAHSGVLPGLERGLAVTFCSWGLALKSSDSETFGRALGAFRSGNFSNAELNFKALLRSQPSHVGALNMLGVLLTLLKRYEEAESYIHRAIKIDARSDVSFYNYGIVLKNLKRPLEALGAFNKAIGIKPAVAETLNNRGTVLNDLGRYDEAINDFDKAISLKPDYAEAFSNKGKSFILSKRYDEALAAFDKALKINSRLSEARLGRGKVFSELNRFEEAFFEYEAALKTNPNLPEAWIARGCLLGDLKRYYESIAAFDNALRLDPKLAEAWLSRGEVCALLKIYDEALAAFDKALTIKPDFAEAWLGRGGVFGELKRYDDSIAAFDKAISLKPNYVEAFCHKGKSLLFSKRYDEALSALDKALAINPDLAEAWLDRGNALSGLERHEEAAQSYQRLLELFPNYDFAKSLVLHEKMFCCDWQNLDIESIDRDVREGKKSGVPFSYQAISNSAKDLRLCAEIFNAERFPRSPVQIWSGKRYNNPKIRIGYLSGEFRNQAVSSLMTELFELHNKDRFELYAFDNGWDDGNELRKRINRAFDSIIDIARLGDLQAATIINQNKIDILVNLNGYFGLERTAVFSQRPAPVQINYLGFSGTMGADYIDYILADTYIIPPEQQAFYTEKVVYLPDTFQVSDSKRTIADRVPTRSELMLPDTGFVFCCFNNSFKITPTIFDIWMRLLKEIDGSVLWLSEGNVAVLHNLCLAAKQRGIAPERLVFSEKAAAHSDYLARYRVADLFLDTFPFNAGTIANDVLWAGTPLITCSGETYPARMAGSLLNAIGVPELITQSLGDYESLALKLARDPSYLASIKAKLARNRRTHPLFDTARFVRHIESAYTTMWERSQKGEPPVSFSVEALPD